MDTFIRLVLVLADQRGDCPTTSRLVAKMESFYRKHGSAVGLI